MCQWSGTWKEGNGAEWVSEHLLGRAGSEANREKGEAVMAFLCEAMRRRRCIWCVVQDQD